MSRDLPAISLPTARFLLLLGVLSIGLVACDEVADQRAFPVVTLSPVSGDCEEDVTVRGSGFPSETTVEMVGHFDFEVTGLGSSLANDSGEFEVTIQADALRPACIPGRDLLVAAAAGPEARATALYTVDSPWRLTITDTASCAAPVNINVGGEGFPPNESIEIHWGESVQGAEFSFAHLVNAQADDSGRFEKSVDLSAPCATGEDFALYAFPGNVPTSTGWAKATIEGPTSEPD